MLYQKFKKIINTSHNYPNETELIYKYGFTRNEINTISETKYLDHDFIKLPLKDEQGKEILFWGHQKIKLNFLDAQDLIRNATINQLYVFSDSEIINGFIFSEIEASLAIEGIKSTRAEIEKITALDYDQLSEQNDIIIKNMLIGYQFVKDNQINEQNIFKLYNILSKKCLTESEKLLEGQLYRHGGVNIVDSAQNIVDHGVSYQLLPHLMNDLITFINLEKSYEDHLLASHMIHYYLIYLHPYFDYNGRMARVMSFWYNYKYAPSLSLLLVSEAINNKVHKSGYYNAIANSRKANNDITYFLQYLGNIILKYAKIYVNFYSIINKLKEAGQQLSRPVELALKQVLAISPSSEGYFSWKDYMSMSNDNYSKQYCLRLLNHLEKLNIVEVKHHKKAKFYRLKTKQWHLY